MAYADYEFYTNVYLGNVIAPEDFSRLAERASEYVYSFTKGLSDKVYGKDLESVQKAVCAVAEVLLDESNMASAVFNGEAAVASETVGSWSRNYRAASISSAELEYINNRKREALMLYLGNLEAFAPLFKVRSYRCLCKW